MRSTAYHEQWGALFLVPYWCRNSANTGVFMLFGIQQHQRKRSILCHGDTWKRSPCALSFLCCFHGFIGIFTSCAEDTDDPFFCLIPLSTYQLVRKSPQTHIAQRLDKNHNLSEVFRTLQPLISHPTTSKPCNP